MAKIDVPESVLSSIAGEEMVLLQKKNKALEKKISKMELSLRELREKEQRVDNLLRYFRTVTRDLQDELNLYDYD